MAVQALHRQETERDLLVAEDVDPAVRFGAQRLISSHRAGAPVDIKSWGSAEAVYGEVTAKLVAYGMEQGLAQDMTRRLVDYAVEKAEIFQSEHQAKIIALRVAVAEVNPAPQFETGPVATFRLNGASRYAEMASASGQSVRLTATGTATTSSDRSSVENVFKGVKEWSVWGKVEAPDKSELKNVAPDVVMAALAQMAAGDLSPEEVAVLQSQLDFLAAEGVIAPELAEVVRSIETMRMMIAGGIAPDAAVIQSLAENIAAQITQGVENGAMSPELARQVMEAVASFSESNGLGQVFSSDMMQGVSAVIEWTAVKQALAEIMPHLSAEHRTVIEAMLESGDVPPAEALIEQLAVINDIIAQADLPPSMTAHIVAIGQSAAVLQDIAQNRIEAAMGADLAIGAASLGLDGLDAVGVQAAIEELTSRDPATLTPEQAALLTLLQDGAGNADLSGIAPAHIEAGLSGQGDPSIDAAIISMAQPEAGAPASDATVNISSDAPVMAEGGIAAPMVFDMASPATGGELPSVAAPEIVAGRAPIVPDDTTSQPSIAPDRNAPDIDVAAVILPESHDIVAPPQPPARGPEIIVDSAPDPVVPVAPENTPPKPAPVGVAPPPPPVAPKQPAPMPANDEGKALPICCRPDFKSAAATGQLPELTRKHIQQNFTQAEIAQHGGEITLRRKLDDLRQKYSIDDFKHYGGEKNLLVVVEKDRLQQAEIYEYINTPDRTTLAQIKTDIEDLYFSSSDGIGGGPDMKSEFDDCACCKNPEEKEAANRKGNHDAVQGQAASDDDLDNLFDDDDNDMSKKLQKQAPALRAA